MTVEAAPPIAVAVEDGVAMVTLNRPAKRNAITLAMWRELADAFRRLGDDRSVRAIVLTGAGGDFSVGADITEFATVRASDAQSAAYEVCVDAASEAIAAAPKPVIAALSGYCLGGGCHLSMACDFRYAESGAQIGIPAARLSIVYGVRSTQRLLSLVGTTQAKRMLYTAVQLTADEAFAIGLVDRVCADPLGEARTQAVAMAALAPLSIAGTKQILNGLAMGHGALDEDAAQAAIDRASNSDDYREARTAFQERRPPRFVGR